MATYAKFTSKSAPLAYDFGINLAKLHFGEDVFNDWPKYVKGPKKGLPKGRIYWKRVVSGGWVSEGGYDDRYGMHNGHVETRVGKIISFVMNSDIFNPEESKTLYAGDIWENWG